MLPLATPEDIPLFQRFIAQTAEGMAERGWEIDPQGLPDGSSIFLGNFRRQVAADFVATVTFILESGPTVYSAKRQPFRGTSHAQQLDATIGAWFGVRHLPTEQLLHLLRAHCEPDISLDLEEIVSQVGGTLPRITDRESVDEASRVLLRLTDDHALQFATEHASIDAMLSFVSDGKQDDRDQEFRYMFIPALLAAGGCADRARSALAEFSILPRQAPTDSEEYDRFAQALLKWLDDPTSV